MKYLFGKLLYKFIGCHLPASSSKFFGKLGKKFRGWCGKHILKKAGSNINIERNARFSSGVSLGDNSGIGVNAFLQGKISIGRNVMMGPNVRIYTVNHQTNRIDIPMCQQGNQEERPVTIGDDVWIADGVIICPGSCIGNGAILGAGAVVRGEIPDYAVVDGNPGTIIKYRNKK